MLHGTLGPGITYPKARILIGYTQGWHGPLPGPGLRKSREHGGQYRIRA